VRICLLRHGQTDWNKQGKIQGREDIPLNNAGIEQIKKAAEYIKKLNWEIIVASPLSRAKMSAQILSKELKNLEILYDINLIERDYGEASGKTKAERASLFPDGKWNGMEPFDQLQRRTINALTKYTNEYNEGNIIIVAHGEAIRSILTYISDTETGTEEIVWQPGKNAHISYLEKTDDKYKIIFYNKTVDELEISQT